jgi:hypothetical protein
MVKILVMIPAPGEVYDRNCVRAYDYYNAEKNVQKYYNMGDLFVYDSSLKLLEFEQLDVLTIREFSQKNIDRYNSEYDYCFLRGSNYIHSYMDWEQAISVLEKLTIPVIAFGIGAQAPQTGKLNLSPETKRVLELLSDRCVTMGVRGAYTAEVLNDLGIKNIDIIGCPTLYRNNRPNLKITLPPLEEIESVGYTLRREVSSIYSSSVANYIKIQKEMIFELNERFSLTVMAQGEIEEKIIFYRCQELFDRAVKNLISLKWFENASDPILNIYQDKMFYSESVAGYEDLVRKLDLVVGYRLHGNLIALANQTPAIYCNYDSRTREFANTYKIPCYDVESGKKFVLEEYYQQELFDKFNQNYQHYYGVMSNFLSKNGMAHKMKSQVSVT